MNKILLSFVFLFFTLTAAAQSVNTVNDTTATLKFEVLPDHGYSLNRVLKDKLLSFIPTDSLLSAGSYWLKIIVNNPKDTPQGYNLTAFPNFNTIFYSYNRIVGKWNRHQSTPYKDIPSQLGSHPYQIGAFTTDTLYIWGNISVPNIVHNKFRAEIMLTPKAQTDRLKEHIKIAWLLGIVVLVLFFLNNLYIYIYLKDSSILHYLVAQLGAMLYLTGYWYLIDLPSKHIFTFILGNRFKYYEINLLLTHIAIVIVFYGFVQLTRSYLNTKVHLPIEDRILKYGLYIYITASFILTVINMSVFYIDYYTVLYDNFYCALLIAFILYTTIKAYLRRLPLAMPYLLANLLPLTFMLGIPLYHLLVSYASQHNPWLPLIGVISQALGFSIALVTRTKSIQDDLNASKIEGRQLEFNLRESAYLNQLNEMEITKINTHMQLEKDRNELLQERLEFNQRELASSTLNMVQKSELLTFLKDQIQKLNWMDRYHTKKNVDELNTLLESNIQLDSEWNKFKLHFEQVHPEFFENLKKQQPTLTAKEIRLYTYFQMNLSHKEIAALLAIDPASVRRAKTRLYKKMAHSSEND